MLFNPLMLIFKHLILDPKMQWGCYAALSNLFLRGEIFIYCGLVQNSRPGAIPGFREISKYVETSLQEIFVIRVLLHSVPHVVKSKPDIRKQYVIAFQN